MPKLESPPPLPPCPHPFAPLIRARSLYLSIFACLSPTGSPKSRDAPVLWPPPRTRSGGAWVVLGLSFYRHSQSLWFCPWQPLLQCWRQADRWGLLNRWSQGAYGGWWLHATGETGKHYRWVVAGLYPLCTWPLKSECWNGRDHDVSARPQNSVGKSYDFVIKFAACALRIQSMVKNWQLFQVVVQQPRMSWHLCAAVHLAVNVALNCITGPAWQTTWLLMKLLKFLQL